MEPGALPAPVRDRGRSLPGTRQGLFSEAERDEIIWLIANNPTVGDLIRGTGGVRKVRFAFGGRGKSGGARVIYFFHDQDMPIYLLTVFAKNQASSLTQAERNSLRGLTQQLVTAHKGDHLG